jgi:hypothetical protein
VEPLVSRADLKSDQRQKCPSKLKFNMPNVNLPTFRRKKDTAFPDSDVPSKEVTDETGSSVEINEPSLLDDPSVIKETSADEIVLDVPTFDDLIPDEPHSSDIEELDVLAPSVDVIDEDAIVIESDAEVEPIPSSFVERLESPGDLKGTLNVFLLSFFFSFFIIIFLMKAFYM